MSNGVFSLSLRHHNSRHRHRIIYQREALHKFCLFRRDDTAIINRSNCLCARTKYPSWASTSLHTATAMQHSMHDRRMRVAVLQWLLFAWLQTQAVPTHKFSCQTAQDQILSRNVRLRRIAWHDDIIVWRKSISPMSHDGCWLSLVRWQRAMVCHVKLHFAKKMIISPLFAYVVHAFLSNFTDDCVSCTYRRRGIRPWQWLTNSHQPAKDARDFRVGLWLIAMR